MQNASQLGSTSGVKPILPQNKMPMLAGIAILVIASGFLTGYLITNKKVKSRNPQVSSIQTSQNEAGAKDISAFKDSATGTLQSGGIKGEGTYHLDRPGGDTQTVYLTSTVIDMGPFVGKKVQVWGQTQASKYAPWFMDVGKIKVVE